MPPKVKKPRKPRTRKPKVTVTKNERQKQKQAVNVNVRIDQSKRTRAGGSGGGAATRQAPSSIIYFPSNTPVSEIRYNPDYRNPPAPPEPSAPLGMTEPSKVTENILAKTDDEPIRIYKNPNRTETSSLLGTVGSIGVSFLNDSFPDAVQPTEPSVLNAATSVGSQLLSEAYPEYSGIFDLASQFSQSNVGKKIGKRVARSVYDAWDNLSFTASKSAPRTVVSADTLSMRGNAPSVDSTVYSSNVYDWLGQDSAMDNSTIPTRSTLPVKSSDSSVGETKVKPVDYTSETLLEQRVPAKVNKISSDEEPPFQAGIVAGRVMQTENRIRKTREESAYDVFRRENKGRYTRAQMSEAWAIEKKKKGM